jgi:DNA-binding CsgD family transcriptional regulator
MSFGQPRLTPREQEVLHWLAEGKRNSEIATILVCSTRTIEKHVENILAKTGTETRTAAAQTKSQS